MFIFPPDQCKRHLIWWIKWWHSSELFCVCAFSLFLFQSWKLHFWSPLSFQSYFLYRPSTPSTYSPNSLYILPIWFLPIPEALAKVLYLHKAILISPAHHSWSPRSFNMCNSFGLDHILPIFGIFWLYVFVSHLNKSVFVSLKVVSILV